MTLAQLSPETQDALRLWARDQLDDQLLFDSIGGAPAEWAWLCFLLRVSEDRPGWFPKGKFATIQAIEERLYEEARNAIQIPAKRLRAHMGNEPG